MATTLRERPVLDLPNRASPPAASLKIQEVSERTGLSTHTLRYYEKAGLLAPVDRSDGGARRYSERDVDSLLFITRLRMTGMSIQGIRAYVNMVRAGVDTIEARRAHLEAHRSEVVSQIEALQACLNAVDYKIDLYKRGWVPASGDDPCLIRLRALCQLTNPE